MKKYVKAEIVAKNLRSGSYAAGCPSYGTSGYALIFAYYTYFVPLILKEGAYILLKPGFSSAKYKGYH